MFCVNGNADCSGLVAAEMEFLRSVEWEKRMVNEKIIVI
jgi:hypothetical protein